MKQCYVSIPFKVKAISGGRFVDFEYLYYDVIRPCVYNLGYEAFRADELRGDSVVHAAIASAIVNSELMIADISSRSPNVLYEVGLRHGLRSGTTVVISNARERIPFALSNIFVVRYGLDDERPTLEEMEGLRKQLARAIKEGEESHSSYRSPLEEIFEGLPANLTAGRAKPTSVFIGHGHNPLWRAVRDYIRDDLCLQVNAYESESHVGEALVPVLEKMLRNATFAVLVLTAEDEPAAGRSGARQNGVPGA